MNKHRLSLPLELTFPIEFLVYGTPMSWQAKRAASKTRWKMQVREACRAVLPDGHFATDARLAVTLFYFTGDDQGDIDNIIKLVLDALARFVYLDDDQVDRVVVQRFNSEDEFPIDEPSDRLAEAIREPAPLLYVKVSNDLFEDFR